MKKILLILLFIPLLNYGQFIKKDKIQHIIAGAGISTITSLTVMAISKDKHSKATLRNAKIISFGMSVLAGYIREKQGNKFDYDDWGNTALGGLTASYTLDLCYKSKKEYIF